jgi:hypothetical protein
MTTLSATQLGRGHLNATATVGRFPGKGKSDGGRPALLPVAAVLLLGVVIRFQDLDQVVQGSVRAVALGPEDHHVAM